MNKKNSLTVHMMNSVHEIWKNELKISRQWIENETYEKVFEFLNNRENLCTPGFILRRHLQIYFPEIIEKAAKSSGVSEYADLTKSGNVKWDSKLVKSLAQILQETNFDLIKNPNIEARQWENFLNDFTSCNRETAVKIIFALDLDETTAAKFLIADGKNLLNARNPSDYLYNFCRKCNFSYDTSLELLKKFEDERNILEEKNLPPQNFVENATTLMENETQRISSNDKLNDKEKQRQILETMLKYYAEFVKKITRKNGDAVYPSGFSKQNCSKLKVLLKYLTDMYPTFLQYEVFSHTELTGEKVDESFLSEKEIQRNADGSPKSPVNLTSAMNDSQEIYLFHTEELAELGLLTGEFPTPENVEDAAKTKKTRVTTKREYNEIPFNNEIILPLKNLSQTLRSNLRTDNPNNAQDVERSTVLFLAYFFICSCCSLDDKNLKNLYGKLQNDIKAEKDSIKNNLRFALLKVIENIRGLNPKNKVSLFVKSLNQLLKSFGCNEFYAPFVIDRCILLCLLTIGKDGKNDYPKYLMAQIIEQSYSFSKKKIESAKQPPEKIN